MKQIPYEPPQLEFFRLDRQLSLLVNFSLESDYEDWGDGTPLDSSSSYSDWGSGPEF